MNDGMGKTGGAGEFHHLFGLGGAAFHEERGG
jgi:hypothetical protein